MDPYLTSEPEAVVQCRMADEHIAWVTLNRSAARNAVSLALAERLSQTVQALEADDQIWAVVLSGAGEVFCAGADLKAIAAGQGNDLFRPYGGFAGFVDAPRRKPWIAALNGPALAGGCEIMLACDMVVAQRSAAIGLPEVSRGLLAAAGGLIRLPRALPRNVAIEMAITGAPMPAERAHALGLINRLVDEPDGLLPAALSLAQAVVRNAPLSVRESLAIVKQVHDHTETALQAAVWQARDRLVQAEDYREGPRAFIEKRAPRWQGR